MKLAEYQVTGAAFLAARRSALLADVMGLGKTAQAIRALDSLGASDVLVLCPASVRDGWRLQFHLWSPLDHAVRLIETTTATAAPGVLVCSYELAMHPPIYAQLLARRYDVLILDEAHRLKNRAARTTRRVFGARCDGRAGLAARAHRVWCLTGTPVMNDPTELYPLLRAFDAWQKDYWSFARTFTKGFNGPYGYKVTGLRNVATLRRLLDRVMLRRRLEDVDLVLPPLTFEERIVEPGPVPMEFFVGEGWFADRERARADLERHAEVVRACLHSQLGHDRVRALSAVAVATAPLRRYVGLSKVEPAVALVNQVLLAPNWRPRGTDGPKIKPRKGPKVVVFAYHRDVLLMLKGLLRELRPILYWGGLDPKVRRAYLNDFVEKPWRRVLLAQIQAAGVGLDGLQQVANMVILVEASWSPAENAQAIMRVHRNGQTRPVRVFFLSAAGTIDVQINNILKRKTQYLTAVLD